MNRLALVIMLVGTRAMTACGGNTGDVMRIGNQVTYSVTVTITTNEVNEADYKKQEPGYEWTTDHTPRNYAWASINSVCFVTNSIVMYGSHNQAQVNAPDPFEEKVTVTRFVEVSNALYKMHVGPFESDQATRHTVLRRWQVVHKQKINMSESTETIEN